MGLVERILDFGAFAYKNAGRRWRPTFVSASEFRYPVSVDPRPDPGTPYVAQPVVPIVASESHWAVVNPPEYAPKA
jgi:hypothetical protein